MNALWIFLEKYQYLWGAVFIVIGLFLCLFGRKLFKPAIFIIGLTGSIFLLMLMFYSIFLSNNTKTYVGWIILIVSIIIGVAVGFVLVRLNKVGVAVLGGYGGACLGLVLWNAFLYKINS